MLRKQRIFKTDCNLQAACSFNNNLFLFQGMLQCSLTIALFDRLQKKHVLLVNTSGNAVLVSSRGVSMYIYIYIYSYIYIYIHRDR